MGEGNQRSQRWIENAWSVVALLMISDILRSEGRVWECHTSLKLKALMLFARGSLSGTGGRGQPSGVPGVARVTYRAGKTLSKEADMYKGL